MSENNSLMPSNVHNIINFMTDQHRIDTLGCLGNENAQTPNIDSLAADGCIFEKGFTPTAICTPARSSMLTGKLPFKHLTLANPEWNIAYSTAIPEDDWTYTQQLRDDGYNVGMVGKYHCGTNLPDKFGCDDDTYWGAENPVNNEKYTAWLEENHLPPVKAHDIWRGKLPGNRDGHIIAARLDQPEEATFERFIADVSIAKLRQYAKDYRESDKPFSLDVHFFGPHLPYFLPDEWFDLIDPESIVLPKNFGDTLVGKPPIQQNYATYWSTSSFNNDQWRKLIAVYWGYVAMIDFEIGRILEVVRELDLMDDTAMFFCADHGEFTGSHRLNDKGPAMYDEIYRIPFIVRIPGLTHGNRCREYVNLLDLTATIIDIAGGDTSQVEDGKSLVRLAAGKPEADWRQDIVCEFHGLHFPVQQRMLRNDDYKLIVSHESINELYDLKRDPDEMNNVYAAPAYDEIRRQMACELYIQLKERGDSAFAKWMAAMTDFDIPLVSTAKSDWDEIAK
ncbi:arylsulfatase A-like enzyme [Mobiluncus mulieris]|uniref:Choline-sulfatase n=1 Tax=Mobiluncus mulieris TaxID=2052 RepID=A0A8G2HUJ9_9ACTO|nr:sulfatase-like hydrolase/transferase [Mobiluncus mulieris]MBB5846984.1 arylsulfatase A-like enzyme [Mobiluncus mulieris]MCV0012334.1 sulfatase-like hydrolase/transferase [Mobiluncus mulieris]STO16560.1 Choline-sulfatase [Mobiluncus mulieris]